MSSISVRSWSCLLGRLQRSGQSPGCSLAPLRGSRPVGLLHMGLVLGHRSPRSFSSGGRCTFGSLFSLARCPAVGFCIASPFRIPLPGRLSLSLVIGGSALGNGCLRLVCVLSHIGSRSFLGVWGLLLERRLCISVLCLSISGMVSCLGGLLPSSCCTVGDVVGSSFCSLRHVNLLARPVLTGICPGSVPVRKRRLGA